MLEGRFEHFATFFDFFRRFPKIFRNFGNLSECLFLYSRMLFPKCIRVGVSLVLGLGGGINMME